MRILVRETKLWYYLYMMKSWLYFTYFLFFFSVIHLIFQADGFYLNGNRIYVIGILQLVVTANFALSLLMLIYNLSMKKEQMITIRVLSLSIAALFLFLITSVLCHGVCGLLGEPKLGI